MASRLSFASAQQLEAPAPNWRFYVELPDLPQPAQGRNQLLANSGGVLGRLLSGQNIKNAIAPKKEGIIAESFSFSIPWAGAQPRFGGGREKYFAGFLTTDTANMQLYESQDYRTTEYLYKWRQLVVDEDGNYNESAKYKFSVDVNIYDAVDDTVPVMEVRLVDAWPSVAPQGHSWAYAEGDRIKLDVTFSYDTVRLKINSSDTLEGAIGRLGNSVIRNFGIDPSVFKTFGL